MEAVLSLWQVTPIYTFKSGMRRTWGVRAVEDPNMTKVQHDYGLAVIQEAPPRQPQTKTKVERWQHPTAAPSNRTSQPPGTWSEVVKQTDTIRDGASVKSRSAPSVSNPAASESEAMQQTMRQTIAEAVTAAMAAAMAPLVAQMDLMQKDIVDMQNADMDI